MTYMQNKKEGDKTIKMCPLKILSVINQEIINERKVISMRKSVKK